VEALTADGLVEQIRHIGGKRVATLNWLSFISDAANAPSLDRLSTPVQSRVV
jgi:hypothetical protein